MEKNKAMLIVIIVLLVLLLGAMIGGGVYIVTSGVLTGDVEETVEEEEPALTQEQITNIDIAEAITTNLLVGADNKNHVAKVGVSIGINNSEDESELFIASFQEKLSVVKDAINEVLRNTTYEDIKAAGGDTMLKNEILDKLRKAFNSNLIVDVYFKEVFLQ